MKRTTKTLGATSGLLLLSLFGASTASAAECVPAPPVWQPITTPGTPAVDAETHEEHQYARTVITPAIPAIPAVEEISHVEQRYTRTVVVTPAVPGVDAVTKVETKWSKSTSIRGWEATGQTRKVVTQEAVPGTPAVDAVTHDEYRFGRTVVVTPYQPGSPAVDAVLGTRVVTPEIPYAPAVYDTVVVTPAVPAQEAVYATAYQYQKQVRGVVQTRKGNGAWKNDGTFDWKWYPSTLTQWSERDVDVLQSGPHKDYLNETQNRREVTTEYRYVKNGVTKQGSLITPAVPAQPAVTKQVLVKAEQPYVAAVTEVYEVTPAIPAVPEVAEVTERQETDWVLTAPEGDGWEQIDHRVVEDSAAVPAVEAIPEKSHLLYEHTRTVEVSPAVPAVEAVTKEETTDLLAEAPEGEGWTVVEGSQETVVDVPGSPEVPGVDEVRDEQRTDWLTEAPEGEGWEIVDTRVVVDKEAVLAVLPTVDWDLVSPAVVCPPEVVTVVTPPTTVTVTVPAPTTAAPAAYAPKHAQQPVKAAEQAEETGLAHTGADVALLASLGGLALAGGAGALVVARRRRATQE